MSSKLGRGRPAITLRLNLYLSLQPFDALTLL